MLIIRPIEGIKLISEFGWRYEKFLGQNLVGNSEFYMYVTRSPNCGGSALVA